MSQRWGQRSNRKVFKASTSAPILPFSKSMVRVAFTTNADDIVSLPRANAGDIGKYIDVFATTGFEIRAQVAAATLNNVTVGATNEGAVVAGTFLRLQVVGVDTWLTTSLTTIDGTQSQLVPDAV